MMPLRRVASTLPAAAGTLLLSAHPLPASAHRLDEYLQATTIALAEDHIDALLCLTPGVAVFPAVVKSIDTDHDGRISSAEQQAYVARVMHDLTLTLDGDRLPLHQASYRFASAEEMKNGVGEIDIVFKADIPHDAKDRKDGRYSGSGRARRLTFENRHQSRLSVYLVNCLVPTDPNLQVTAQDRNYTQSHYKLDYVQTSGSDNHLPVPNSNETMTAGTRMNAWVWLSAGSAGAMALIVSTILPWHRQHAGATLKGK